MSEPARCASCGLPLDPPGPGGLCPVCLLKMGLDAGEGPDTAGAPTSGAPAAGAVPGVIGPYHVLQVIGEGGMGLVYLAEQREPLVRRVALKLIKPGMDTREVLARFEAERQALALMDHPNIARVLDAGLGPGDRPYFVMEYVAGIPITDYCDRHRLRNAERLQIFLQVCAALQHAHQKGIIHRDIKPSNILVTVQDGKPVPKIIDFGIAKATRQGSLERAAFTQLGMLIGTPEDISPEQAEASGLEVDTTTDIYSLGVVLYELLTGVLPFDSDTLRRAGYAEMHRIIREQDPPKPSLRVTALGATAADIARQHQTTTPGLGKQLRGDLDAIAMKAMEKDRTRRYASASEFAADITRYLNGEAVVASPPSVVYRTRKFVRRHRLGVAAAALVVASLTAGLAVSTGLYLKAEESRRETERQRTVADRRSYVANLAAAEAAIRSNKVEEARTRLAACPPELRNWEWRHLWSRTDASFATLGSSAGTPTAVSVTPDGERVVWLTENGVLRSAGLSRRPLVADAPYVPGIADAPQAVIAVSGDGLRGLVVPRALPSLGASFSGRELPRARPGRPPEVGEAIAEWTVTALAADPLDWVTNPALSGARSDSFPPLRPDVITPLAVVDLPHGRRLTSVAHPHVGVSAPLLFTVPPPSDATKNGRNTIVFDSDIVWDNFGRTLGRMSGRVGSTVSAAFSRDGRHIATWTWDRVVRVWNAENGRAEVSLAGHRDGITQVVFSPDGSRVASASHDGTVRVWTRGSPAAASVFGAGGAAMLAVAFSPDGGRVVSGGADGHAHISDLGGKELVRLAGHEAPVTAVAFSPDGTRVATGSSDRSVRLWDASTGRLEDLLRGHGHEVSCLAFSPDGRTLVSGSPDQTIRLWDATRPASSRVPFEAAFAVKAFAWSSNPISLFGASFDGSLQMWNPGRPERVRRWRTLPAKPDSRSTEGIVEPLEFLDALVAVSAGGDRVVTTHGDGRVAVWTLDRPDPTILQERSSDTADGVAVSPDGSFVAAASRSGALRIWNAHTQRLVVSWRHEGRVWGVFFSPDLKLVAAASETMVTVWPRSGGAPLGVFRGNGSQARLRAFAFSPDSRIVACGYHDGAIRLWRVADGASTGVLRGDAEAIWSLAFDPAGSRLASGSFAGTVRVWDVAAAEPVFAFSDKPRTTAREGYPLVVTFDGDGRRLLAAGPDSIVTSFDSQTAYPPGAVAAVTAASQIDPSPSSIAARLSEDLSLSLEVRQAAITLARERGSDPDVLCDWAWSRAWRAGGETDSYERALEFASAAVAAVPFKRRFVDTLAVAQYRTGRYQESLATLKRSAALRGGTPDELHLLFMAMCHTRLGEPGLAKAVLEQYRARPARSFAYLDDELAIWLKEATALVLGPAPG